HWIEYWSGRLVVARGNSLLFSEPLRYGVYDQLRGFVQFEERIFRVAPLDTGRFVGLRNSVRCLGGTDPPECPRRRGRATSGRGDSLLFSGPLRYGVYDQLPGFVQFEERIFWVAPLDTGLFVGLRNSVRWLGGTDPAEFTQRRVGGKSWRGAAAVLPSDHLSE